LTKLFIAPGRQEDEVKSVQNIILKLFWQEWNEFNTRTELFDANKYIWGSDDIATNRSHFWHKINSYNDTKWLGKLACVVCSKTGGIGNAERSWSSVKTLVSGKRAHLSPETTSKQATIYGAACAERAAIAAFKKPDKDAVFTMWEDVDMDDLGLNKFGFEKKQVERPEPAQK
jgi:hypothetical protein